ncbi:nitrogen permease regulator of amino acid transport activity 3-domain-containing protein [Absidia repens]|uniref:Nitrogen permease regulator 3 n=1 Tax=Absidia repens TaxID=90262 RepID=A0A1X2IE01_9FUNG|nr:nitrogen permease regulator of amino acid transport activity 3-domain-containing protein [Absidia repens]
MNSLLAILLVINSTRGHHYVFSYPADPQRPSKTTVTADKYNVANSTSKANTSHERLPPNAASSHTDTNKINSNNNSSSTNGTSSTNGNSNNNSNSGTSGKEDEQQTQDTSEQAQGDGGRDTIFDIDVSLLADTLSPKPALCDRKFQLGLDDLTFVGHPVGLTTPNATTEYHRHGHHHHSHHHHHHHSHHHHHHHSSHHQHQHQVQSQSKPITDTNDYSSIHASSSSPQSTQQPAMNRTNDTSTPLSPKGFQQQDSNHLSRSPVITASSSSSSPAIQRNPLHMSSSTNMPTATLSPSISGTSNKSTISSSSSSSSDGTSTYDENSTNDSNDQGSTSSSSSNSSESDNGDHHVQANNSNDNNNNNNTKNSNQNGDPNSHSVDDYTSSNNGNDNNNNTDNNHSNNNNSNTNGHDSGNNNGPSRSHGKRKKSNRGGDGTKFDRSTTMTQFHVVFVLSPADLEVNTQVNAIYRHVVMRYTAALRYEQLRCGYVQDEVEKVLAIRDDDDNATLDYSMVMQTILQQSSLARDIRHIYTALTTRTTAHVIINDFIDVSLQIPLFTQQSRRSTFGAAMTQHSQRHQQQKLAQTDDQKKKQQQHQQQQQKQQKEQQEHQKKNIKGVIAPTSNSTSGPLLGYDSQSASLLDIYGMSGYEYDHYPVLCPYHTLLLLEDPEEVLKNMPLDASPTLVQLIQILTPTQTLQELHLILDCSLAQIYRLAAHLIYWRKAKLIHPIHARNNYVLSPKAKFKDLALIEQDFKLHVPSLNLPVFLSQLSYGKPLYRITPSKEYRNQYLEAITYLVRKDWIIQLHMFLVLMEPWPNDEEGGKWAHEKAPKEVADLLVRLVPYMDGKHPIEEIMYREAVSRKQLGLVLKYYRQYTVTMYR